MGTIKRLQREIVEKIAAGEVVERPVSVVKECVENAIDARATMVRIELKAGGKDVIIISDNGSGMSRADALLSVERHTTSKISTLADLFNIRHLGFRGEALASIAAVSRLSIVTNDGAGTGTRVVVDGDGKRVEEVAAPKGTTIAVRNLFYNTPARRKFLASETGELRLIVDVVTNYALAYPEIGFIVKNNESEILSAPATVDLRSKVAHIYGMDVAKNMVPVLHSGSIRVDGLIGIPSIARSTRAFESFFVNRRYIKSKLLTDALESAYKTLLFLDKKPVAVLNITIEPGRIDVNVHPTKQEVKFDSEELVFTEVHLAVKEALEHNVLIEKQPESQQSVLGRILSNATKNAPEGKIDMGKQTMLAREHSSPGFKVLGQVAKSFIIAEVPDGLIIVDQHAAEERINLERLNKTLDSNQKPQQLLQPILVSPPKHNVPIIKEGLAHLRELGFDVESFGEHQFIVRQVPVILGGGVTKDYLKDLFDELAANLKKTKSGMVKEEIIHTMACKASVKANEELSPAEMSSLLEKLFECNLAYACAHGRPTVIKFTRVDLEKMFKRK